MQSLFPTQGGPNQGSQVLYQFRAGKCQLTSQPNGKFLVQPDLRRGTVFLKRGQDSLLHFHWQSLQNSAVEDDRIIMAGDATFKKIKAGKETDRVFMLKFTHGTQKFLFWLQAKDTSKDEEIVKKVNEILANGGQAPAPEAGVGGMGGQPNWLAQMMGMNPNAAQMMGGMPGMNPNQNRPAQPAPAQATPAPAAAGAGTAQPPGHIGGLDFSALLAQMNAQSGNQPAQTPAPAPSSATPSIRRPTHTLGDVLQADELIRSGVLSDERVQAELIAQLPPGQQTADQLQSTIRSPQFQQAVSSLSEALADPGNYQNIARNFNLDPSSGMTQLTSGDTTGAFLAAVQSAAPKESGPVSSGGRETKPGEEKKDEEKKEGGGDDTKMEE